jgi:hypothetical protein
VSPRAVTKRLRRRSHKPAAPWYAETLWERHPKRLILPLHGALIKNEQDMHLFERLAFMSRREGC